MLTTIFNSLNIIAGVSASRPRMPPVPLVPRTPPVLFLGRCGSLVARDRLQEGRVEDVVHTGILLVDGTGLLLSLMLLVIALGVT